MQTRTLEEKVRAVMSGDDTGQGPISVAAKEPASDPQLTALELDLRDWGVYYGVAFGIAVGEDPYEPRDEAAARALEAARRVYREWGGFISSPSNWTKTATWPSSRDESQRRGGAGPRGGPPDADDRSPRGRRRARVHRLRARHDGEEFDGASDRRKVHERIGWLLDTDEALEAAERGKGVGIDDHPFLEEFARQGGEYGAEIVAEGLAGRNEAHVRCGRGLISFANRLGVYEGVVV